jgi:hypothetical protein
MTVEMYKKELNSRTGGTKENKLEWEGQNAELCKKSDKLEERKFVQ